MKFTAHVDIQSCVPKIRIFTYVNTYVSHGVKYKFGFNCMYIVT